jgi:trimeric autotransporter adhesin
MKRISSSVASVLMLCIALAGCGGGSKSSTTTNSTPTLVSIAIAGSTTSVPVGTTLQLTATGKYSDGSSSNLTSQVTWESSDGTLATTNSAGLLTAVKKGPVTVVATKGTVSGTLNLTVTSAALTSISVSGGNALAAGSNEQLTVQGTYSDGASQTVTSQSSWQTSDATIATVSGTGQVSSLKAGSVVITANVGSVSNTATIIVNSATLSSIIVNGGAALASGASEQLMAQGVYSDSSTQSLTSQVIWQSSNTSIATFGGAGMLTALKSGSVTVTATLGSVSGTATVVVNAPTLSSITISPAAFSIASGQSEQLKAQGVLSDGTTQDVTAQVAWGTSDGIVASVSPLGLVTGVSAGSTTITATLGTATKTATATVTAALLNTIVVTPLTASIATGQTQAFAANGIFSDGSTTDITNSVTWSSGATNFATIDPTGVALGINAGSALITATSGAAFGTATLTVTPAVLSSIDISPDGEIIPIGGQTQLTLTGSYTDNTTQNLANATWSSSDSTIASVDPVSGVVTGVSNSNGNPVTITASYGGMTSTTTVFVTDAVAESLTLTPVTASIANGTTQQYSVSAVYSDGSIQPLTSGLSWISSSAATASIDSTGLATGIAPGQATITVAYGSLIGSATLTVTPAALTAIVVTPVTTVVGINGNVQFTATGVFTDNSTQDVTSQVQWNSSVANFALISDSGLATGVSAGATTIIASYGSISGTAKLTVTTATLVSITITPANQIVPPHSKIQLTAIGVFSDGTQVKLSGVSWHTTSARYAMVSGSGVLRTKKSTNQPVSVYASLNGITGQTGVTITSMSIQSLKLIPGTPTIAVGTIQPLALIGTFSDGVTTVDLSPSARWQTSNYQDAVITRGGVASGLAAGSVTITGSYGGLTPATTTLTISNATIQSIDVTPASPTIALGSLEQFVATGTFSDGSTQDITTVSQWTTSTPTVAIVNKTGLASSATHGQTNVNATFKGTTGSTLLTVN